MTAARDLPFVGSPSDHEPHVAVAAGGRAAAMQAVSAPLFGRNRL
jgi:hypothetical protein